MKNTAHKKEDMKMNISTALVVTKINYFYFFVVLLLDYYYIFTVVHSITSYKKQK